MEETNPPIQNTTPKDRSALYKLLTVALIITFITGTWVKCNYFPSEETAIKKEVNATVLLNRIESVAKLITVEGYFSEVYDYKDYWKYDYSPFQKQALIRIKGKVSVGYDFKKMKFESRPNEKKIVITNLADPEILAIDHDLDYYDISEGTFNSFTEADYNLINKNAKEKIREAANQSDLKMTAEKEALEMYKIMEMMIESSGWTFEYKSRVEQDTLAD